MENKEAIKILRDNADIARFTANYKELEALELAINALEDVLNKSVCTRDYSVKHCMNCKHLIFKQYDNRRGYCRILRMHRRFSDPCVHEEEMS